MTETPNEPFFSAALVEHLQQRPHDPLYHYTGQNGLIKIIETRSLLATNIGYMNDATEFDLSLGLLRDRIFDVLQQKEMEANHFSSTDPARSMRAAYIKERAHIIWQILKKIKSSSICVTCFCEDGNLLSQWRGYSGGGYGYSLGFRATELKDIAFNGGFILGKCIYDPDKQNRIVHELVEYILAEGAPAEPPGVNDLITLLQYGAFFKHPSFEQEQEWRLVSPSLRKSFSEKGSL